MEIEYLFTMVTRMIMFLLGLSVSSFFMGYCFKAGWDARIKQDRVMYGDDIPPGEPEEKP